MMAVIIYLILSIILLFNFNTASHIIASETSKINKKYEHFMPLVAFQCGYRNKFMNIDGRWQNDPSSVAGCLHGKYDILKYCKRVYPNEEINNIVEYTHLTKIDNWCREEGNNCKNQFTVRPFRCIGGEFVTESLQVPHRCHFDHFIGKDKCNDFKFWNKKGDQECSTKKETKSSNNNQQQLSLRSFALLEPCGLGMFRGVEFVCCPKDLEEKIEKIVVDLETPLNEKKSSSSDVEEEEDEDDEEYSDEDDDEENSEIDDKLSKSSKKKEKISKEEEQDPYFKEDNTENEHERFREAEERLEKKHRKKVTKVITGWSELFERYNKMKEKDPKGAEQYKREMTGKFRKTISSLETENREQRKQLEDLHNERVQTSLNEKKRQATHEYRAALAIQVGKDNKENVLRTLKNYIRAEEKDRLHMLNRYRHLLRSGQEEEAISFEPILLHRLRYIDLRINGTLAMLRDFPDLEKELRPKSLSFWKAYRRENTPEELERKNEGEIKKKLNYLNDEERNERLIKLYKQSFSSSKQKDDTFIESHKSSSPLIEHKSMIVSLKDVLNDNNNNKEKGKQMEEDSDEDQFEEDEDTEEEKMTTIVPAPSSTVKIPVKIHVELLKPYGMAKLKTTKINKGEESSTSEEEEEEEDDDNDEEEEIGNAKRKQIKNINIEPIVLAPSPNELLIKEENEQKIINNYNNNNKHKELFSSYNNKEEENVGNLFEDANLIVLIGLIILTIIILTIILFLFKGKRNRHRGFIEVDVCTPEESHITGMQINGYENPTYAFFESKQPC